MCRPGCTDGRHVPTCPLHHDVADWDLPYGFSAEADGSGAEENDFGGS